MLLLIWLLWILILLLIVLVYLEGDRSGDTIYILRVYFLRRNPFFNLNSFIQTIISYNIILLASSTTSRILFKILLIYLLVS
jgi:hypothetical protein